KYRQWLAAYAEVVERPSIAKKIREAGREDTKRQTKSEKEGSDVKGLRRRAATELSEADLNRLIGRLMMRTKVDLPRYDCGLVTAAMIRTSMMTGLRPSEWNRTQLLQNVPIPGKPGEVYRYVLHVVGAAKGARKQRVRRLVLDEWDDANIETLRLFMAELPSGHSEHRA